MEGGGIPSGSVVKNPPASARSMGREDPLEKEMATHSSIFAWEATVHGVAESRTRLSNFTFFLSFFHLQRKLGNIICSLVAVCPSKIWGVILLKGRRIIDTERHLLISASIDISWYLEKTD